MSLALVGLHCQEGLLHLNDGIPDLVMTAQHEHCPGGFTTPGLLGGWYCTCPCHKERAGDSQGTATKETT